MQLRPIHSVGVICGDQRYPEKENIKKWIRELSEQAWFINATNAAAKLENPILGNIIIVGALEATRMLPLGRDSFETAISSAMPAPKVKINLTALEQGGEMIKKYADRAG